MPDLDVRHGTLVRLDTLDEVGPQLANVLVVRLIQMRVLVDGWFLGICGVERPAVEPTHVERPLRAVEIASDIGLLGFVAGIEAMLPGGGERLELEAHHLGIGSGGVVAQDVTPAGREHPARILLLRPPQDLVHPVDTPVAELAVGVIEKLPEALGMDLLVEGMQGRGTAPEVPVEPLRRGRILYPLAFAARIMYEGAHHADPAGSA